MAWGGGGARHHSDRRSAKGLLEVLIPGFPCNMPVISVWEAYLPKPISPVHPRAVNEDGVEEDSVPRAHLQVYPW